MKKYVVLFVLFVLPLVAYLFFSSGINSFGKLPVLKENLSLLNEFETDEIAFDNKITILTFFGNDFDVKKVHAFNMKEKIYDRYHKFDDFQVVTLAATNSEDKIENLKVKSIKLQMLRNGFFLNYQTLKLKRCLKVWNLI